MALSVPTFGKADDPNRREGSAASLPYRNFARSIPLPARLDPSRREVTPVPSDAVELEMPDKHPVRSDNTNHRTWH